MPARFDHAVVIVPSLKRAVQSFERLGFCVVPGGRTGPVHNALFLFSDGTYIELTTNRFSVVRPVYRALNTAGLMGHVAAKRKDMLHRFLPWIGARQGAIDWCIRVDNIRDAVRRIRDAGIEMVDEMEFDRERPDGKVARWLLAGPRDVRRVDQVRGDVGQRVEIRLLCWLDRFAPWLTNWLFLQSLNQSRKDLEAP